MTYIYFLFILSIDIVHVSHGETKLFSINAWKYRSPLSPELFFFLGGGQSEFRSSMQETAGCIWNAKPAQIYGVKINMAKRSCCNLYHISKWRRQTHSQSQTTFCLHTDVDWESNYSRSHNNTLHWSQRIAKHPPESSHFFANVNNGRSFQLREVSSIVEKTR